MKLCFVLPVNIFTVCYINLSWPHNSMSNLTTQFVFQVYNIMFNITERKSTRVLLIAVYLMFAGKLVVVCT